MDSAGVLIIIHWQQTAMCVQAFRGCCQQKGAYSRLLLYMAYEVLPVMRSSVVRGCMRNRHLLSERERYHESQKR